MELSFWVLCLQNKEIFPFSSPCFCVVSYLQECGSYRQCAIIREKWQYDDAICIEEIANRSMRFYSNEPPLWLHLLLDKWKICIDSTSYYIPTTSDLHFVSICILLTYCKNCWNSASRFLPKENSCSANLVSPLHFQFPVLTRLE